MKRLGWIALLWISMSTYAMAGAPVHCTDHHARIVVWVEDNSLQKAMHPTYQTNGQPLIRINPEAVSGLGLSEDATHFLYLHECAHHVLGHVVRPPNDVESFRTQVDQADCWAGNKYYYTGQMDKLTAIQEELNGLEPGQWNQIPGPRRVLNLEDICRFTKPVWPN